VLSPNGPPSSYLLDGEGLTIGGRPDNDIPLVDPAAAEQHGRIDWNGRQVTITDFGAPAGTLLDGRPIRPNTHQLWLPEQTIQIGPTSLRLVAPIAASLVDSPPEEVQAAPTSTLTPRDIVVEPTVSHLILTPGMHATMQIMLKNLSRYTDHYMVTAEGDWPPEWVVSKIAPFKLNPNDGGAVELTIKVGRDWRYAAKDYTAIIRATSSAEARVSNVSEPVTWTVIPYTEHSLELVKPARRRAVRRTIYPLKVINRGNAPVSYLLDAVTEDEERRPEFISIPIQ